MRCAELHFFAAKFAQTVEATVQNSAIALLARARARARTIHTLTDATTIAKIHMEVRVATNLTSGALS